MKTQTNVPNRRHRQLFFAEFQKWFIWSFVLYTAGFLAILSTGLYFWYRASAKEFMELSGLLSMTFHDKMEHSLHQGIWLLVALNLSLLWFAMYGALRFSKKIAGPIYALYRHLDEISRTGEWKPLKLRNGDLFSDLPEKLNRARQATSQPSEQRKAV